MSANLCKDLKAPVYNVFGYVPCTVCLFVDNAKVCNSVDSLGGAFNMKHNLASLED